MSERLLTARELGEYLGYAPATVLDKFERHELPGFKLPGGAVRFRPSEVEGWLEQHRRGPVFENPARDSRPVSVSLPDVTRGR